MNNMARSDTHVAMAKNGFLNSKVSLYNIDELDNALSIENTDGITWEANEKDCTHINYC